MRKVLVTVELLMQVPDDIDLCENEDDPSAPWCAYSYCGGECTKYFFERIKNYHNDVKSEKSTEYVSSTFYRHEDCDDDEN